MVAHHDGILQQQEVRTPPELLNLGERPWWRGRSPDRNELWELKFIFLGEVLTILNIFNVYFAKLLNKDGYLLFRIQFIAVVRLGAILLLELLHLLDLSIVLILCCCLLCLKSAESTDLADLPCKLLNSLSLGQMRCLGV